MTITSEGPREFEVRQREGDGETSHRVTVPEHARRTGSPVAGRVLGHWKAMTSHWVKVMPRDYKRALRDLARREEERPTTTVAG